MTTGSPTVTTLNDNNLISFLQAASRRIFFMAPGVSEEVARVLGEQWRELGAEAVNIVVDADPEVCRLGYGTLSGLEFLQRAAEQSRSVLCHQPGIRIGLAIVDDRVLVFAPIPELIEAGTKQDSHPNAIQISSLPDDIASFRCEMGVCWPTG